MSLNASSIRLTASSFFLLMIFAYIWVVSTLVCPSSLLTVYKSTPKVSIIVPKVCLLQWKVIGYARKNMQVKFERKSFEMNDVSVFCQVGKMQTATEY